MDLKQQMLLRMQMARLDFVSKMTHLLGALVLGAVLFVLGAIIVLFLSYMAMLALKPYVGSATAACGVIALGYIVIGWIIYAFRDRLILSPLANFLGGLFLNDETENNPGHDEKNLHA